MHGELHCKWLHSSATVHSKEHSAQDIGSHSYSSNIFCGGFRVLSQTKNRKNNTVWIHVGLGTLPNIQVFVEVHFVARLNNFFPKKTSNYYFIHDCVRLLISTILSNWHFQWMDGRFVIWLLFFNNLICNLIGEVKVWRISHNDKKHNLENLNTRFCQNLKNTSNIKNLVIFSLGLNFPNEEERIWKIRLQLVWRTRQKQHINNLNHQQNIIFYTHWNNQEKVPTII